MMDDVSKECPSAVGWMEKFPDYVFLFIWNDHYFGAVYIVKITQGKEQELRDHCSVQEHIQLTGRRMVEK